MHLFNLFNELFLSALDSYGKPPAGILDIHVWWMGSYDECKGIDPENVKFKGKYCTTRYNSVSHI